MASATTKQLYVALTDDDLEQLRIRAIQLKERPSKLIGDAVRAWLKDDKEKK